MIKTYNQDVLKFCKEYKGPLFHSLFCDPPYHLTSITKRFGKKGSVPAKFGEDGAFARVGKGFMNQEWDGGDIAFQPETWESFLPLLYPGAFCMAFASARGWHRMAVAIEDAGFIMHPTIFLWAYGCLSEDTEILTERGWKSYRDILVGHKVMCYNLTSKDLSYMPVEDIYEYDYKDTAYNIHSDSTDQIVSRNHRVIVERDGKQVFQYAETLQQQEIVPILENMQILQDPIYSSERGRVLQKESLFQTVLHRIFSSYTNRKNLEAEKSSSQERTISTEGALDSLSSLQSKTLETKCLVEESKNSNLFYKMQRCSKVCRINKTLFQRAFGLDRRNQKKSEGKHVGGKEPILERWGNLYPKAWKLFTYKICTLSSRIFRYGAERWLCYGASSFSSASIGKMPSSVRSRPSYGPQSTKQSISKLNAVSEQFGSQKVRSTGIPKTTLATITPVQYEGVVWCVKVPTGAFVVRRKGKIFITGNSGFPKATRVKNTRFDGHRYGLQALKPAVEPILVFQKPFDDQPQMNMLETGAGTLNIDAGRIGVTGETRGSTFDPNSKSVNVYGVGLNGNKHAIPIEAGRWPSNFILQDDADKALDAQSGIKKGGFVRNQTKGARPFNNDGKKTDYVTTDVIAEPDGGASRYFYHVQAALDENDPICYCPKANQKEKNAGIDKNPHPCVKPLQLTRYLSSLLLPPAPYAPRRILVPFSGSGSEMIGAGLAGWEDIIGIELSKEYMKIAEQRIKFYLRGV